MLGLQFLGWRGALRRAVESDDVETARQLLHGRRLSGRLCGGPGGLVRMAMKNESPDMLALLLDAGPPAPGLAGGYMALWVERTQRACRDARPDASLRVEAARQALARLVQAKPDWDATLPSLGNGDTAGEVIDYAWPGVRQAMEAAPTVRAEAA